jgi:hypothetical protein
MVIPKHNRLGISDIIQNDFPYFNRLTLVAGQDGKFYLIALKQHKIDNLDSEQIRFEVSRDRLVKFANEILTFLNARQKFEEWKPTMADFEAKLKESWSSDHAIENWLCDYARMLVTFKDCREKEYEAFIRAYEWLKGNEDWLYERR